MFGLTYSGILYMIVLYGAYSLIMCGYGLSLLIYSYFNKSSSSSSSINDLDSTPKPPNATQSSPSTQTAQFNNCGVDTAPRRGYLRPYDHLAIPRTRRERIDPQRADCTPG